MALIDDVLEKAELFFGGELSEAGREKLAALCSAAAASLRGRLRSGVSPESIHDEFVSAAGVLALAMYAAATGEDFSSVRVGNVTLSRSGASAADSLRALAEEMLAGQLRGTGFDFRGVRG